MIRNLKALGLALLAAFALSAIGAQAASAELENHKFETTGETATVLTGAQESGADDHSFTITEKEVVLTCHHATFRGTQEGTSADAVELVPEYTECTSNLGINPTVDTNGCTYKFYGETTENPDTPEVTDAPVSLTGCNNPEVGITITAAGCNIHVPEFEKLHGVTYKNLKEHGPNNNKDAVTVTATVDKIPTISTGGFACLLAGLGSGVNEYVSDYVGKTIVTGYEDEGTHEEWTKEHKVTEGAGVTNILVGGTPG